MRVNLMVLSAEGCELARLDERTGDEHMVKRKGYINPQNIDAVLPCETMPNCIFVRIGAEEHAVVANMEKFMQRVNAFLNHKLINPRN